jgi:hypothetical protein
VGYPLIIDNEFTISRSFENHYWPAVYLIDREGEVRFHHFGEGAYEETERREDAAAWRQRASEGAQEVQQWPVDRVGMSEVGGVSGALDAHDAHAPGQSLA